MKIIVCSHGLKTGPLPPKQDLYLDCRFLPDPSRTKGAPSGGGQLLSVQSWIEMAYNTTPIGPLSKIGNDLCYHILQSVNDTINSLPGRRNLTHLPAEITICCFCAWGIHRSVAAKYLIAKWIKELNDPTYQVEVK